jgi:hypothetical protein
MSELGQEHLGKLAELRSLRAPMRQRDPEDAGWCSRECVLSAEFEAVTGTVGYSSHQGVAASAPSSRWPASTTWFAYSFIVMLGSRCPMNFATCTQSFDWL